MVGFMALFGLGPIGQIARHVSDVGRAVDFYGGVLGLPHLYTFGDLAFFDCSGTRLFLSRPESGAFDPAAQSIIYVRVPDIHAAHDSLTGRGVTFQTPPTMIHRHENGVEEWMALFADPDGSLLAVMA